MTHEQLRMLQAIVSAGSFRGAAERIYKSQPALSKMIKKLEEECGFALFDRATYRPTLTPRGKIFYENARTVLHRFSQLEGLAMQLAAPEETHVHLAVNAICPLSDLLETLKAVAAQFPATRFNLSTEMMGGAMEALSDGSASLAITTQDDMNPETMEAVPFTSIPIIPVAHRDYEPAREQRVHSAEEMRGYVQVLVADSSRHSPEQSRDVIAGVRHWRVSDIATKKQIILAGMGWGGLPEYHVHQELERGELVRIYVEGFAGGHSDQFLIRRTDRPLGVVTQALWDALLGTTKGE